MNATTIHLNLDEYCSPGVRVFSGRERGALVRSEAGLDGADAEGNSVVIHIPEDVISISFGFAMALLAPSVVALGAEEFRRRYHITGSEFHTKILHQVVEAIGGEAHPGAASTADLS